jgi:hypothetical protein
MIMKRLLLFFIALVAAGPLRAQTVTLTPNLNSASTFSGSELFPVYQGTTLHKATVAQVEQAMLLSANTALNPVELNGSGYLPALNGSLLTGLTWSQIGSTPFNVTSGKAFTLLNSLSLSGTDGSTLNIGSGGALGSAAFQPTSAFLSPTGSGAALTALPANTSLYPVLNQNTTGTSSNVTGIVAPANGGTGVAGILNGPRYANGSSADTAETQTQAQTLTAGAVFGTGVAGAATAPLDGANGLWALNSSGNFPSFTLDPSATFTIPSGGTLINNGTLVTTLKQRYFATTTLEQAYVLAQGELGEAGDTGLLYLGDGTTAGGHLANMGVLPTSGTPVSTTYSGQTTTSAGATGGSVYYTAGGSSGYGYTGGPGYFQGGAGNGNFTQSGPAYLDAGPYSSVGPGQGNSANVGTLQNTIAVNIGRSNIITTITGQLSLGSASLGTIPPFIFSDTPTVVTATSGTIIARNTSVIANNTSQVVLNLDYNEPVGSIVRVYGLGSGGWKIAQNAAGEQIIASGHATTAGTSGYLASGTANDSVVLVCLVLHTTWEVIGGTGTYKFN